MSGKPIPEVALAHLLEQTARGLHFLNYDAGLFPAQWTALRYFASADSSQCTAIDLARFQGVAFGPVNRTVRKMIEKKLLARGGSIGRGRAQLIKVTAKGAALLRKDPLQVIADELAKMNDDKKEALAEACDLVINAIQSRNDIKPAAKAASPEINVARLR